MQGTTEGIMTRYLAAALIVSQFGLGAAVAATVADKSVGPDKRIIEWGWDQPDTNYLRQHITDMEKTPFDGVILGARAWTQEGQPVYFSHENWGKRRFTDEELRPAMDDLAATTFSRFTDNFLRINVTPGDVDWFDPDFEAVISNARLAGRLAAAGHLRGFMLDVEMYQSPVFTYRGQKYCQEKTFAEYAAQVRARGREFMAAIQEQMPALVVLMTFANSLLAQAPQERLQDLGYGLLPAFVDGMLDAAGPHTEIVDAYESAYPFRDVAQFAAGRKAILDAGLKLSQVPEGYRQHMRVGFGLWMDQGWRSVGWFPDAPDRNQISPLEFEYALHRALSYTDKYVWVYSEQPNWWTGDKLPAGYAQAVRNARTPHDPGWRTTRTIPAGNRQVTTAASQPGYDDEATFGPLWSKYDKIAELPRTWLFRVDFKRLGEKERWFALDADESPWKPIEIGKFWEEQGYPDYDGPAWYRVRMNVPASARGRRLFLAFGAADETAAVYVNGSLAGKWGLLGFTWNERFEIEVTPYLRPGQENLVAVRVEDSIGMGGLWKPVLMVAPKIAATAAKDMP
jgi:hypothetical protein